MYNFSYDNYDFDSGVATGVAAGLLGFLAVLIIIALAIAIVVYVFESIAIYTIAKNRGIENPWLAWIPFANYWILGQIGDYYSMRETGKKQNLNIWMLCLSLGVFVPFLGYFSLIAAVVLSYVCFYKFYKNVAPNNATLYLVLSILVSITTPFILFFNRNKMDVAAPYGQPQQPYYGQPQQPYYGQQQPYQTTYQPQQQPYQPQQPANPQDGNNVPPQNQ